MSNSVFHLAFAIAVAVHQWEEARALPAWSQTHARRPMRPVFAPAFRWAALLFGLTVWLVGGLAWCAVAGSFWPHVWAGVCLAMALNALVPHLALTLRQRHYMPGTASGLALVLPMALCCIQQDWQAARISGAELLRFTPWVLLATGASVPVFLGLGELLTGRLWPPPSSRGSEETKRK